MNEHSHDSLLFAPLFITHQPSQGTLILQHHLHHLHLSCCSLHYLTGIMSSHVVLDLVSDNEEEEEEYTQNKTEANSQQTTTAASSSSPLLVRPRSPPYHDMSDGEEQKPSVQPTCKRRRETGTSLMEAHTLALIVAHDALDNEGDSNNHHQSVELEEGELSSTATSTVSAVAAPTPEVIDISSDENVDEVEDDGDDSVDDADDFLLRSSLKPYEENSSDISPDELEDGEVSDADDSSINTSDPLLTSADRDLLAGLSHTPSSSKPKRRASVSRYFSVSEADLSLKCFNCGAGGHIQADCDVAKIHAACYICGHPMDHQHGKQGCPREVCYRCGQEGHHSRVRSIKSRQTDRQTTDHLSRLHSHT